MLGLWERSVLLPICIQDNKCLCSFIPVNDRGLQETSQLTTCGVIRTNVNRINIVNTTIRSSCISYSNLNIIKTESIAEGGGALYLRKGPNLNLYYLIDK